MIKRKSTMLLLAVAGLMLAAGAAQAATMASANFGYKYEADALPLEAEWYKSAGVTVANGLLSYDGDGELISALPAIFSPTTTTDYTVEGRFSVANRGGLMPGVHLVVGNSDSYGFFTISETTIHLLNATGGHDLIASDLDNTGMHTYRIAYTAGAVDRFSLWRDDSLISDDLVGYTGGATCLYFGDVAGATIGAASLDYMRIDTTGAYAPVPEPATMSLLAVGGLAALRRRRK